MAKDVTKPRTRKLVVWTELEVNRTQCVRVDELGKGKAGLDNVRDSSIDISLACHVDDSSGSRVFPFGSVFASNLKIFYELIEGAGSPFGAFAARCD